MSIRSSLVTNKIVKREMSIFFTKKFKYIVFVCILLILFITYSDLFSTFYQQDEWRGFSSAHIKGLSNFFSGYSLPSILLGEGRKIVVPIHYIFYNYFPFSVTPFVVFSIIFHGINSFLVFLITQKISKNTFIATIAGLFFAFATIHHQAISWTAANTTTLPSAFFCFLAIFTYLKFEELKKKNLLYLSLFFALISTYFKESSFFIFLFIPLLSLVNSYSKNKKFNWSVTIHFLSVFIAVSVLRYLGRIVFTARDTLEGSKISLSLDSVISHIIFYPFTSLSQMYINPDTLFSLSSKFMTIYYPYLTNSAISQLTSETVVGDFLSIFFSLIIILALILLTNKYKTFRPFVFLVFSYIFLSILPHALITKGNTYMESRYYYMSMAGAGMLLGFFLYSIMSFQKKLLPFMRTVVVLLFGGIIFYNIQTTRQDIEQLVEISKERKNILLTMKELVPRLEKKTIFLIESDTEYIVPGNTLPFQQGTGYTIMAWYLDTSPLPREFFEENFLWDIGSQGYSEKAGKGFGYYSDKTTLEAEIKERNLNDVTIISLYYDSATNRLTENVFAKIPSGSYD